MGISYHIYGVGTNGFIDYSTPLATTAGLTWNSPPLAVPSDNRFAVRAFDDVTGLSESNVDAVVHIVIDAAGNDVSARPNAPIGLSARPTMGGGARVAWAYNTATQGGSPTGFHVFLTAGPTVNFAAAPAATVSYFAGLTSFTADLTGLIDEGQYSISVRSFNATATETNTVQVTITGEVVGPAAVDGLTATATT